MSYIVETSLKLKDGVTAPFEKLLDLTGKLDLGFKNLQKEITATGTALKSMGLSIKDVGLGLCQVETASGAVTRNLGGMTNRADSAALSMDRIRMSARIAATSFGFAERELSKLNSQLEISRSSIPRLNMRNGGGGGSGHRDGGHGGGLAGLMSLPGHLAGHAIGAAVDATIGMEIAKEFLTPGLELEHAKNQFRMAPNIGDKEMTRIVAQAQATQRANPTTTVAENITGTRELYGMFGARPEKLQEALDLMTPMSKVKTTMAALAGKMPELEGKSEGLFKQLGQTVELMGGLGTGKEAEEMVNKVGRAIIATGGTVTPAMMAAAAKFSGSAKFGKDEIWQMGGVPYFIQEMVSSKSGGGSSSGGVGPLIKQFDSAFGKGIMSKSFASKMQELGIIPQGIALDTATTRTLVSAGKIKGADEIQRNPLKWAMNTMMPPILKQEGFKNQAEFDKKSLGERQRILAKNEVGTSGGLSNFLSEMVLKHTQIEAHMAAYEHVKDMNVEFDQAMADTGMKMQVTGQEFKNLMSTIGLPDALKGGLDWLNTGLKELNDQATKTGTFMPELSSAVKDLGDAFNSLGIHFPSLKKIVTVLDDFIGAASFSFTNMDENKKLLTDFMSKDDKSTEGPGKMVPGSALVHYGTGTANGASGASGGSSDPSKSLITGLNGYGMINKEPQKSALVHYPSTPQPTVIVHGDNTVISGTSIEKAKEEIEKKHHKKLAQLDQHMAHQQLLFNATQSPNRLGGAYNPMILKN